ncbi:MAG: ATP-dependent DNA ligase [Caldimonas sp.]
MKRGDDEPARDPSEASRPTPIEPMLAKSIEAIPEVGDFLFEPKWDGFRAIVFRSSAADVAIQSRDLKSLDRYFPDLRTALAKALPPSCVLDGEIVVATPAGLDFDALQQRIHPAASRIARLSVETPASFVAFDVLAIDGKDLIELPQAERRRALERLLDTARPPLYLTPATRDRIQAGQWLSRFEGAGLDGIVAKPLDGPYRPGKRSMLKIKHVRTADCVVAGFRWHKSTESGGPAAIGSLLLGLYDEAGVLHHVGITSSFSMEDRRRIAGALEPLSKDAEVGHPWIDEPSTNRSSGPGNVADQSTNAAEQRRPGATSRWSAGKDLSWQPLQIERVCEVRYDHLQGNRFRHATTFQRWRVDKKPAQCRYDQLEVVAPYELKSIFER